MARADLIADLVATGMSRDQTRFRKVVDALTAEERAKNHAVLAEKLQELLGAAPPEAKRVNGTSLIEQKAGSFVCLERGHRRA